MILEFDAHVKEKIKNSRTADGYIHDAAQFMHYLETDQVKIKDVKEINIKKYNLHLKELGYSNHTVARKNSALRLYFKFLRKKGIIHTHPMEDIKQPVLEKRETRLTDEDMREIEKLAHSARDKLLFCLAHKEKIKISEIVKLTKENYLQNQGILYTEKKAVSLKDETKEMLDQIAGNLRVGGYLVPNHRNEKLSDVGAYFIVKSYFKQIGKEDLRPVDLYKK